nr:probable serine/threonine-protein kinase PBL9 [Tanacetum cinerariifolium]
RIKVALIDANALAYLHNPKAKVVYHGFKSSIILLDSDYNAKLCILWLAKDEPLDGNSRVSTQVVGTNEYAALEYIATDMLDLSGSDVVKVVIDVAYICNVAPVFHVLAHTKKKTVQDRKQRHDTKMCGVAFKDFYQGRTIISVADLTFDDWSGGCMTVSGTEEICIGGERLRIIFL